jgi:hypothetical protein
MRLGANGRGCIGVVWVWLRALTRFFIPASWWSCRPRTRSSDLGRRSARNAGRKAWRRLLARRRSVRLRLNCVCVCQQAAVVFLHIHAPDEVGE